MPLVKLLLFLTGRVFSRPQASQCDPIFDTCSEPLICDEEDIFHPCHDTSTKSAVICDEEDIFCEGPTTSRIVPTTTKSTVSKICIDKVNEIDDAHIVGDLRQAFNVCDKQSTCVTYKDEGYRCAPSWTCRNNTIITDGIGIIDVRSDDFLCGQTTGTLDASDSKCEKIDYVCCKHPDLKATNCRRPNLNNNPEFAQCGRSSARLKITGQKAEDRNAQPGEFPHMCVIYRYKGYQRVFIGGASLIARNKVLTVANKYIARRAGGEDWKDQISDFYIRCGEHSVKNEIELLEPQESQVARITIHPQYDKRRLYYDLAILHTSQNFVYQEHIGPVCLPEPLQNFDNQRACWSSGWGADDFNSASIHGDFLKKVQMPVIPSSECEIRTSSSEFYTNKPSFRVHKSWLCIGGEEGSDTCKGDGGSPHVCKNKRDRWVQVGAVSWGKGCGTTIPSLYSSVPAAMCWIDWVMSCIPLAEYDIDNNFVDDQDIRDGTSVESKNKLSSRHCEEWLQSNPKLYERCEVIYK